MLLNLNEDNVGLLNDVDENILRDLNDQEIALNGKGVTFIMGDLSQKVFLISQMELLLVTCMLL